MSLRIVRVRRQTRACFRANTLGSGNLVRLTLAIVICPKVEREFLLWHRKPERYGWHVTIYPRSLFGRIRLSASAKPCGHKKDLGFRDGNHRDASADRSPRGRHPSGQRSTVSRNFHEDSHHFAYGAIMTELLCVIG
jgi:hypothetical protein